MIKLGLIGKDISHSKSQDIYEKILKKRIAYELFDYPSDETVDELDYFFSRVDGISITSPFKTLFSSEVVLLDEARELKIINCIRKSVNGFEGVNTDYLAVRDFLDSYKDLEKHQIILLGNGSMSKMTEHYLKKNKIDFIHKYRSGDSNFKNLNLAKMARDLNQKIFVINSCARKYQYNGEVSSEIVFWDYNYSHEFHQSRMNSSSTLYIDGMELLKNQAIHALKFWDI